jgi:hypothetical protein
MRKAFTAVAVMGSLAALAGCGETKIDKGKAEGLARKVAGSGTVKLKTVSCPSGLAAKKGATFDCSLVYVDGAKGTITIHQTDSNGHVETGASDIHIQGP